MRFRAVLILLLIAPYLANGVSNFRCAGGEGGTPFSDISNIYKYSKAIVPTQRMVKEYVYLENKNEIVYRNDQNVLHSLNLTDNKDRAIKEMQATLGRVVDPLEKFITTAFGPWILDITKDEPMWMQFPVPRPIVKHLFWKENVLYSYLASQVGTKKQTFTFSMYEAGRTMTQSCTINAKVGETYRIGNGHEYPFFYLYRIARTYKGNMLTQYRVRLNEMFTDAKCQLEDKGTYPEPLPGDVKSVTHYPKYDAFAVSINHPRKNLLWDTPTECTFFDLHGRDPIILNNQHPIVATRTVDHGLGLHFLDSSKEVRILQANLPQAITEDNLWLSKDANKLFVAVQPANYENKVILKLDLPDPKNY